MKISLNKYGAVYEKTEGHCGYCGIEVRPFNGWQVDHMVTIKQGGTENIDNLIPSCQRCNLKKRARDPEQFRTWLLDSIEERIIWIQNHLDDLRPMFNDDSYYGIFSATITLIEVIEQTDVSFFYDTYKGNQ